MICWSIWLAASAFPTKSAQAETSPMSSYPRQLLNANGRTFPGGSGGATHASAHSSHACLRRAICASALPSRTLSATRARSSSSNTSLTKQSSVWLIAPAYAIEPLIKPRRTRPNSSQRLVVHRADRDALRSLLEGMTGGHVRRSARRGRRLRLLRLREAANRQQPRTRLHLE